MSAPFIWIGLPLIISLLLWLPRRANITTLIGGLTTLALALTAWFVPIDTAIRISATISIKIAASYEIFGRQIAILPETQPLLALLYGLATFWFFGASAAGIARYLVPLGMAILSLLIASLAVQPFLYAALLIQTASLIAVPLLSPPNKKPGSGVIRFLVYQTLAMPFILFAGWLLAGVESNPGDIELLTQAAVLLALGFAFLFAIFPLYTWVPRLMEETSPYAVGFILWLLPTASLFFSLGFLDRYAWLREYPQLPAAFRAAGVLMVVTGGVWAAFQRHLGRMMGYAAVMNTGFSLLALSLFAEHQLSAFFLLLVPQSLGLAVWSLSLSALQLQKHSLTLKNLQGYLQHYPIIISGILFAHFSAQGLPLLAGFPPIIAIWEGVAANRLTSALWLGVGITGLLTGAIRTLAVTVMAESGAGWELSGGLVQNILISIGIFIIFFLGLFPQVLHPILSQLPFAFPYLAG